MNFLICLIVPLKKNVKRSLITYLDKGYICGLMNMTSISNTVKVARIVSCIFELL